MSNLLLMFIVFIEGFASLGDEVIALRRLMPHVGSSITVTVPTIGLFLAALAMGYWSGGRIQDRFLERVLRNFLFAAFIAGVGLSSMAVPDTELPQSGWPRASVDGRYEKLFISGHFGIAVATERGAQDPQFL